MQTAIIVRHAGEEVLVRLEGFHVPASAIAVDTRHRSWESWQPVPDGMNVVEVRLEGTPPAGAVLTRTYDDTGREVPAGTTRGYVFVCASVPKDAIHFDTPTFDRTVYAPNMNVAMDALNDEGVTIVMWKGWADQ